MMNLKYDNLNVIISNNRNLMGKIAAKSAAGIIGRILSLQDEIRIVFAAAPSQDEFLDELIKQPIEWEKCIAFHMDEYIGLAEDAPQLFSNYLNKKIFSKVPFKEVHLINSSVNNPAEECERYAELIKECPIDLVCMGIGENGHIAFNDPPVADFNDPKTVKIVKLDEACRNQQVNDGCFFTFKEVPEKAVSLTVPALMSAKYLSIVVPGSRKGMAVYKTLTNIISTSCPSTILRKHENAVLFLDHDSAEMLINIEDIGK